MSSRTNALTQPQPTLTAKRSAKTVSQVELASEISGELTENADYLAAKEEQARLEQRSALLKDRLLRVCLAAEPAPDGAVEIGTHVRIRDRDARTTEE
jgi:transcription elongation GreA/GreB family factor